MSSSALANILRATLQGILPMNLKFLRPMETTAVNIMQKLPDAVLQSLLQYRCLSSLSLPVPTLLESI